MSNQIKKLLMTGTVVLGMAIASGPANAQTETMSATLTTSSAITSNVVSSMDFGEWLIQFVTGDTPVLTLTDDGSVSVTQTGSVVNGSQLVQITAPATEGVITVQTPAPSTLTMTRSNTTDFTDPGLSLATTTFQTASESGNIDADTDTATITVVAGATDETVTFGGTVAVSATPADAAHTAQFDITFSY